MFDWNKHTDGASAASGKGAERKVNEDSLRQQLSSSLSVQEPELAVPGPSAAQSRQGYCSCCHLHYSNLEQHVYSSQHRLFASYCRNRLGTASLMERFLQDVLQHHPSRYHDNRPTYDDMPLPSPLLVPRDESVLSVEALEKEKTTSRGEAPSTECGFTAESGCLVSQRSREEPKETYAPVTSIQKPDRGQEHSLETSQHTTGILSNTTPPCQPEGAQTGRSRQKAPFIAVTLLSRSLPISHFPPTPPVTAKNVRSLTMPDFVSNSRYEQPKHGLCSQDRLPNSNSSPLLWSAQSRTASHESPVGSQGNSLSSGQFILKQDVSQPQDETLISDFCLRDTRNPAGKSCSLNFGAAPQLAGKKESKMSGRDETSVDEIIEEVILKYCYEALPKELPCEDEGKNSSINILSLLDHSSLHDSDMSFDCDAAIQSGAAPPKSALDNLELLKDVHVSLQDESYGTQLSCILQNSSVQQAAEVEENASSKEPVLPALPHVPPSFVGKTWSQIMYEDDMKIEALVRDFREGRFRCHFDTESLANCTKRRGKKKRWKDGRRSDMNMANKAEAETAQGLPDVTGILTAGSELGNSSVISEAREIPEIRKPQKRTWRLASRCQVVKVSHGTQTSLVHCPVVKQRIVRKGQNPPDQKANLVWSENEKTPNMKTRLCALKLPESYTKIMSPLQPQTVVYVLSCPEMKQFKSKAVDAPQRRRSRQSTDSKEYVKYKYKQCSMKYYDPLTNRVLKTLPRSIAGEKAKKPPHVRQLFRSLSLDANRKKQAAGQHGCLLHKPFRSVDFHSSSASFMPDPVKENDGNSGHRTDGSSISTEKSECLVCNNSEKSYKHLVLSPLNAHQSQQEDDFKVTPLNRKEVNSSLKSLVSDYLERGSPKTKWQRKKSNSREPGLSQKTLGPVFGRHSLVRRSSRKQAPRTTAQPSDGRRKISSCTLKSSALPVSRYQTKETTVGKHLKKEKPDAKKLKVMRKPQRVFLNTTAVMGVPEKRQRATKRTSLKIKKWEVNGDKGLLCAVK
ncbi:DBF4-type zinc finger-containing protein 2 [Eublepharis macularius]|uniref:DBF4-type zinc finger-containing protein 2 n=1 Tax=Eublepharis macularius TaxID=481883 RepID=A0AA97KPH2_EUBMA|nr:DBF4-type zinc finger-containing protein 2 [Eublepharis macularius]